VGYLSVSHQAQSRLHAVPATTATARMRGSKARLELAGALLDAGRRCLACCRSLCSVRISKDICLLSTRGDTSPAIVTPTSNANDSCSSSRMKSRN
jgi:hypothetical protein